MNANDLSTTQAAALANVSEVTIRRWVSRGVIQARKLPGGRVVVSRRELTRVLQGTNITPRSGPMC